MRGGKFKIQTNHLILKYVFDQPNLNAWEARWLEFLSKFEFDIRHVKGKENKVMDSFRREFHVTTISMYQTYLKDKILEAAANEEFILQAN